MIKKKKLLKDKGGTIHLDNTIPVSKEEQIGHEFTEYLYTTKIISDIKKKAKKKDKKGAGISMYNEIYDRLLKVEYDMWAKKQKVPRKLRELGWKKFCDD